MKERIIDISEHGACLNVCHEQLVIRSEGAETTVPLEELAAVIVAHPAVTYTQAVLSGLCQSGGAFILCDDRRLPIGMILPLTGHFAQTERFAAQARAAKPLQKQLWKQIIRAKIVAQATLLKRVAGRDCGLARMAGLVRSGDPSNFEAQASRVYWERLFGPSFRRDRQADDQNRMLNYGYAVLRALVTRAVCAAGLHPSLGIHHHNRYDPFCLADDLMEPYRSLVDAAVCDMVKGSGPALGPLDREVKARLIRALTSDRYSANREERTLFDLLTKVTASLADIYLGNKRRLFLPVLNHASASA